MAFSLSGLGKPHHNTPLFQALVARLAKIAVLVRAGDGINGEKKSSPPKGRDASTEKPTQRVQYTPSRLSGVVIFEFSALPVNS